MIVLGDLLVRDTVRQGFRALVANPGLLVEILPPTQRNELQGWLVAQDPDRLDERVFLGYPDASVQFPCVSVIISGQQEVTQPIGGFIKDRLVNNTPGDYAYTRGAQYRSSWRVGVLSENANLCVWLAAAVKWTLLRNRDELEDQGLYEQSISVEDYEPDERWLPLFIFTRGVTLSASHFDQYELRADSPTNLTINPPTFQYNDPGGSAGDGGSGTIVIGPGSGSGGGTIVIGPGSGGTSGGGGGGPGWTPGPLQPPAVPCP